MRKVKPHPLAQRFGPPLHGPGTAVQLFDEWLSERLALNDEEVTIAVLRLGQEPVRCRCTERCHHAIVERERQRIATEGVKPWR